MTRMYSNMSKLFTPEEATPHAALAIVSQENEAIIKEILRLRDSVMQDPAARVYIGGKNSIEKRVQHRLWPEVTLQVVTAQAATTERILREHGHVVPAAGAIAIYSQLGVIDADGEMCICIEHRKLPEVDFSDPFTQHVIEQFRTHVDVTAAS